MSQRMPRFARVAGVATIGAVAVVAMALPASAHVTVSPQSAPADGYVQLSFNVPSESDTASTTKLDVQFPTADPIASVAVQPKAGWTYEVRTGAPRVVVATPPHYTHELGALMAAASAAAEGWAVTYLGPDLPVADLVNAVGQSKARAVAISAVAQPEGGDLLEVLRDTRARLPADVTLLVGGAGALEIRAEAEAAGARVVESLAEFRALLLRLAPEAAE